jgi:hypothetical protein
MARSKAGKVQITAGSVEKYGKDHIFIGRWLIELQESLSKTSICAGYR